MKKALALALSAAALLTGGLAGPASAARLEHADHGGRLFTTTLTGAAEVPPGDPDGMGHARITVNRGQGTVCFELEVTDIAPATAAHIHVGPAGVAGPIVVPLSAPTSGHSHGCVDVDRALAKAISMHPDRYYVNVHNADFPPGAVRGQL